MWGALSDEKSGQCFSIFAGHRQCSLSQIWVRRHSWTYFIVSIFETPPTWRARSPYLLVFPPGTVYPNYTLGHWVCGGLISCFSHIRHGLHSKRRSQQFYCCLCILCRGNVSVRQLPSNKAEGGYTDGWEGFKNYAAEKDLCVMHTNFNTDWFRNWKLIRRTHRQHGDAISLLNFFPQNRESRL
jgi:hypothetical protein